MWIIHYFSANLNDKEQSLERLQIFIIYKFRKCYSITSILFSFLLNFVWPDRMCASERENVAQNEQ